MDIAAEIAQVGYDLAKNMKQIALGTERVEKYKADLEELCGLESKVFDTIYPDWGADISKLIALQDVGKLDWHGERRDKIDDILDDNYFNAMRRFENKCIASNVKAIDNRIKELQHLIEDEEGLLAKLDSKNKEIIHRQTELDKKWEDEQFKAQQERLHKAIEQHPEYDD